jgi:hypothetical protein
MSNSKQVFIVSFNRTNQKTINSTYSNLIDAINDINQQIHNITSFHELKPKCVEFNNTSLNNEYYKYQITDFNGNIEYITLSLEKSIIDINII